MEGEYVFRVRFRVEPSVSDVTLSPATFETVLRRRAPEPGTDGWLFFRDNCWRGETTDDDHARRLAEEALGVTVESVDFRELACDRAYYDALRDEIAADLAPFRADDVAEVLTKYLGSSIRVVEE